MQALHLAICALLSISLSGCEGRRRAPSGETGSREREREEARHGPSVAVLDLSEGAPEEPPAGFLGLSSKGISFEALVHQVELLTHDDAVRGVLVRFGTERLDLARATEIGSMLERLGSRLPVWCHADDLANGTLYVAARGCKRVWASPGGSVDAIGIAAQLVYFHKLLVDELGLDVDFLQVGKYKGAEEPFTRDGPSPEALASLEACLFGLRAAWLTGIRSGRPAAAEEAPEDGPYSAPRAKERGLVDDIGYFDDAREALEKQTRAVRAEVRFGPGSDTGADVWSDAIRAMTGDSMSTVPIVVVRAVGAISMEGAGLPGQKGGIVERRLVSTLMRLAKDDDVKAIVLRIDSPGGSALASDLIWHELMGIRAKKPIVVSVGAMAASGGYYLASTGSVIFADETSIVGSIGVVGGKIAVDRALERVGVHSDTVAAKSGDPRAAARAGYESLLVPWDDATRQRLLETMHGIYDLFLARVAEGRGISVERVAQSAEGRIFGGREGQSRGLVDELGGLAEAISRARTLAGLGPDARVGVAAESTGILQELFDDDLQGRAKVDPWMGALTHFGPGLVPFVASVAPLVAGEHAICALPYALTVR